MSTLQLGPDLRPRHPSLTEPRRERASHAQDRLGLAKRFKPGATRFAAGTEPFEPAGQRCGFVGERIDQYSCRVDVAHDASAQGPFPGQDKALRGRPDQAAMRKVSRLKIRTAATTSEGAPRTRKIEFAGMFAARSAPTALGPMMAPTRPQANAEPIAVERLSAE